MMLVLHILSVLIPLIAAYTVRRAYKACANSRCQFFRWPLAYAGIITTVNAFFSAWAWHVVDLHTHTTAEVIATGGFTVFSILLGVVVIVFSVIIEEASSRKREV